MRRQSLTHLLVALTAAVFLAAAGLLAVHAYITDRHSRAQASALAAAEVGAEATAYRVENMLEWVRTLHDLASRFWEVRTTGEARAATALGQHLKEVALRARLSVLQVAIIDADGMLAWSTQPGWAPVNLADREHFAVHRAGRLDPFVSQPLVGRASGRSSVQVTRPILRDGVFAGVVVVSLDPDILERDVADPPLYGGALVAVFRTDGTLLATTAADGGHADCPPSADLTTMARQASRGSGRACTVFAGDSLVAWQMLGRYPLYVAAALPLTAVGADLPRARSTLVVAVVAASAAAGAVVLFALTLRARRRDRVEAARAEAARGETVRLLEALPGAVYRGIVSPDGVYTRLYLSSELGRMTGYPQEALATPPSVRTLMEPDAAADRTAFLLRVLRTGEQTLEYRLSAASGDWLWVRDRCRLVRRLDDGRGEVVGLLSEITAERELQAKAMVASRLATLGEMAAGIAHELNQPAASIAMACDIALLELDGCDVAAAGAVRARLDDIAHQIMRMRNIVDHLRTFSRPDESGHQRVDVGEAVEGALALASGALHASGIRVTLQVAPNLPPVLGRLTALEQVMVNIIGNARDAMAETPTDARNLDITAWRDEGSRQVVIRVCDRGHGLLPGIAERAFEPFFTTKPVGKGTGLGLSIAYGTIRSFGGDIKIANRDGGGAELTIRLMEASDETP